MSERTKEKWRIAHYITSTITNVLVGVFVLAVLISLLSQLAKAAEPQRWPGPYAAQLVAVLDGDTQRFAVRGQCPFGCVNGRIDLRLADIDTPETRLCRRVTTKRAARRASCELCPSAVRRAKLAKFYAKRFLGRGPARLVNMRPGKYYGRAVGDVEVYHKGRWLSLRAALLRLGHGVSYDGTTKAKDWCAG
ncbi:MAG: hypothetical protein AAFO61_09360 [Pseudomonadota bacterium]